MSAKKRIGADWIGDANQHPHDQITIADILTVGTNSTPGNSANSISLTLGNATTGEVYTNNAMLFQQPGLMSIPAPVGTYDMYGNYTATNTATQSAQAISYSRNDQWTVLGIRDTRTQNMPGNASPGDTVLYAQQGQATVICKGGDGSVTISTNTENSSSGNAVSLTISPSGLFFNSPFGTLALDAIGFRVSLSSGASMAMTGTANPLSGNQITFSASSFTAACGIITLANPENGTIPLGAVYGTISAPVPAIPIIGEGVGLVTVNAATSTTVFLGLIYTNTSAYDIGDSFDALSISDNKWEKW